MTISRSEASRQNGSKSVGPVTPEGRAVSSQNALKLGIFSKRRFLADEDPAEFYELLDSLIAVYNPASFAELMQIDRMAMARWKLARVERAEVAVVELQRNYFQFSTEEDKWQRYGHRMLSQRIASLDEPTRKKFIAERDAVVMAALGIAEDPEKFIRLSAALNREYDTALRQLREEQSRRINSIELERVKPGAKETDPAVVDAEVEE